MKRPLVFAAVFTLVLALSALFAARAQFRGAPTEEEANPTAAAWVIADSASGFVLDSMNASRALQIGSLTKIATVMVVLDWAKARGEDLSQTAKVPDSAMTLNSPNSIGLKAGDDITLRDAIYAALLQSDNEAAETLAAHVGGRLAGGGARKAAADFFVAQMNALARSLGMRNTRFLNAHGLDDLEKKLPYSTAHDVALLTNYAMGQPGFAFYTSQKERKIAWTTAAGDARSFVLRNTNELVGSQSIDGVKTGTTRRAGACVVISAAQRPESKQVGDQHVIVPRRLTVVVLGAPSRFAMAKSLLSRGWVLLDQWAQAGRPMKGWRPTASR